MNGQNAEDRETLSTVFQRRLRLWLDFQGQVATRSCQRRLALRQRKAREHGSDSTRLLLRSFEFDFLATVSIAFRQLVDTRALLITGNGAREHVAQSSEPFGG